MIRVPVKPEMLRWARERAGLTQEDLPKKFAKLPEWESGEVQPTLKQLDAFARAVHVPVGYLFLSDPPEESVPIPDFRSISGEAITRPSPNLLDTIYVCQERQSWYRDFARISGRSPLPFVGIATSDSLPETIAAQMRETIGFDLAAQSACGTWTDALREFIRRVGDAGVLVMVNGVVLSNTSRPLDPAEFRGFALSDPFAPLIFINGADSKAAQMFTLVHELAHLWLGVSALSNIGIANLQRKQGPRFRREEVWCNAVAAEFLVPLSALESELSTLRDEAHFPDALKHLARTFKVSNLVILRRLLDANWLSRKRFREAWVQELERLRTLSGGSSGGGDFYRTTLARVGHRFARALVVSTLEGQTLYRDAFRMLGVSKNETFTKLCREVGVMQ